MGTAPDFDAWRSALWSWFVEGGVEAESKLGFSSIISIFFLELTSFLFTSSVFFLSIFLGVPVVAPNNASDIFAPIVPSFSFTTYFLGAFG